jgi:hypothetical protein
MAKAKTQNNTDPHEWIRLSVYVDRMTAEVLSQELAKRIVCDRLGSKQIPYRYLDAKGHPHHDNLTDRFWRKAVLDLATSSAVQPAEDYDYEHVDLGFEVLGHVSESAVKVYRIEVLVPQLECAVVRAPAEVSVPTHRTGLAGKPNIKHFLEDEFARRVASGEIDLQATTLHQDAEDLQLWWEQKRQTYTPVVQSMTVESIENAIRDKRRAAVTAAQQKK